MSYIDGFVIAVTNENKEAYRQMVADLWPMFKEYGALSINEFWGDDIPEGEVTSYPLALQLKPSESVVFAWNSWPDKATRDAAYEKMRTDPRLNNPDPPFDGKRMIWGGFTEFASFGA